MAINLDKIVIKSPKRTRGGRSGWEGFFPYYAGYTESFAENILASANLSHESVVLDPWNGSGTTTFAASQLGIQSVGVDLNPVMAVVARARTLPASERSSLVPLGRELLERAQRYPAKAKNEDALREWFGPGTSSSLRSIETAIAEVLLSDDDNRNHRIATISALAATYYVALFALGKELAKIYQSSNPTWLRRLRPGEKRSSMPRQKISDRFIAILTEMADALSQQLLIFDHAPIQLLTEDTAAGLSSLNRKADFVLTSPPYCTRLDYTAATKIQLAVLSPHLTVTPRQLSRYMTGSVRVPVGPVEPQERWGGTCNKFLRAVKEHPSKASSGYYLKTHLDYFSKMYTSISSIAGALKENGTAVLVVQDSFYKNIHNDVPRIITEMAESLGFDLRRRVDFHLRRTLAGRHPHARTYRSNVSATEAVICLQRN